MSQLPTIQAQPAKAKAMKPVDAPSQVAMPTSEAEQICADMDYECRRDHEIADVMLENIVREGRTPSFAEQTFFKGRCGWADPEIQLQLSRTAARIRYQSVAGSASQRQAAVDEQLKSAEILAVEGKKLDEQIQRLTEQKAALEKNATRAERVCEQINQAVESLRSVDVLRSDLKAKHEAKRREFAASTWDKLNAVKIEINFREQMLETQTDKRKLLEMVRLHFADCSEWDGFNHCWAVDSDKWGDRKRTMALELIELRDEFDRLSSTREKQMAELDGICNHYLEEK